MKIQNEYLIILDQEKTKGFSSLCNTEERFNEFLCSNRNLKISGEKIEHNNNKYSYSVKKGGVNEGGQIFFYLTTSCEDVKGINKYKDYLKELKTALTNDNLIIETLRDDISFYYCQQAYSLIHTIENLMRKFITYFMVTNIGTNWVEESSPEQIKQALAKSKRKQSIDILQQLDFIHLGNFLFKSYNNEDISTLFEKIKSLDDSKKSVDIDLVKSYLPKSNWEKYFRNKVDCDDSYLKSRWEKIYDLRNKVAHTSTFSESDYNNLSKMVQEVKTKLETAFNKIDSLDLKQEEKNSISENISASVASSNITKTEAYELVKNALPIIAPAASIIRPAASIIGPAASIINMILKP